MAAVPVLANTVDSHTLPMPLSHTQIFSSTRIDNVLPARSRIPPGLAALAQRSNYSVRVTTRRGPTGEKVRVQSLTEVMANSQLLQIRVRHPYRILVIASESV